MVSRKAKISVINAEIYVQTFILLFVLDQFLIGEPLLLHFFGWQSPTKYLQSQNANI